jgi:hypothetical protein
MAHHGVRTLVFRGWAGPAELDLLLRLALRQVELLELTDHPHRRRRWRVERDWAEERLNS